MRTFGFPVITECPFCAGEITTDVAPATDAKASPKGNAEDAKLAELGYTQKLDRSVGTLASFAIGFATISATTSVFTGFGAGYFTAGAPFVWTLLLAGAVFTLWAFIAADLTAKLPLVGYSYQWISRTNGSPTWPGSPASSH
jgi:hypothetical protein